MRNNTVLVFGAAIAALLLSILFLLPPHPEKVEEVAKVEGTVYVAQESYDEQFANMAREVVKGLVIIDSQVLPIDALPPEVVTELKKEHPTANQAYAVLFMTCEQNSKGENIRLRFIYVTAIVNGKIGTKGILINTPALQGDARRCGSL